MRPVSCSAATLWVVDLPDPTPGKGQLVLDVLRCGICGSDLHAREHCDELAEVMDELDYGQFMRRDRPTVMGHEFVGEVRERGRGVRKEFRDTLHALADGKVDASPLITGTVGLDGVAAAYDALGDPERHAKILIDPASAATAPG
ncbi:MAG TPA: alcohol dehydrogenase catalytic domain-containing protein [Nocardioides sp.]|nr:alcohol dehydrogenase catalytic domain-containing protein [Nocardioides sp.]